MGALSRELVAKREVPARSVFVCVWSWALMRGVVFEGPESGTNARSHV